MAGKYTKKLGEKLDVKLNSRYKAYYDHGKKTAENNVCRPTPFFGENYGTSSSLSFVDIVIVEEGENDKEGKVKLLCEIEESRATPKKIIGDIINLLVSDGMCIKENPYYRYESPLFILGLTVNENGKSCQKAESLKQRLKDLIVEPRRWNLLDDIEIICENDSYKLIEHVESRILDWANNT